MKDLFSFLPAPFDMIAAAVAVGVIVVSFIAVSPEELPTLALNGKQVLMVNCTGDMSPAARERVRRFVAAGGFLYTTDHAVHQLIEPIFPNTIAWTGTTLGLWLLLIASMLVMGVRSPMRLLSVATIAAATVYGLLIFLLNTRLPRGLIEKLIAGALGQGG